MATQTLDAATLTPPARERLIGRTVRRLETHGHQADPLGKASATRGEMVSLSVLAGPSQIAAPAFVQ